MTDAAVAPVADPVVATIKSSVSAAVDTKVAAVKAEVAVVETEARSWFANHKWELIAVAAAVLGAVAGHLVK